MRRALILIPFLILGGLYLFSFATVCASFSGGILQGEISLFHQNLTSCGKHFVLNIFPFQACFFISLFVISFSCPLLLFSEEVLTSSILCAGILGAVGVTYNHFVSYLLSVQRGGALSIGSSLHVFKYSTVSLSAFFPPGLLAVILPFVVLIPLAVIEEVRKK